MWVGCLSRRDCCFGTCRLVLARQRGPDLPGGLPLPDGAWRLSPSAAPLTRGSVDSIFRLPSPVRAYRTVRDRDCIRHLAKMEHLGSITGRLRRGRRIIIAGQQYIFRLTSNGLWLRSHNSDPNHVHFVTWDTDLRTLYRSSLSAGPWQRSLTGYTDRSSQLPPDTRNLTTRSRRNVESQLDNSFTKSSSTPALRENAGDGWADCRAARSVINILRISHSPSAFSRSADPNPRSG